MNRKLIFRWIKVIVLIYSIIGILFYYLQDKLFFHPLPVPADSTYAFTAPYKELNIPYNEKSVINIIQFTSDSLPKGVILYFHGNRENIGRYADQAPQFTRHGYELWMIDYPGFGKSTGDFTEQRLYDWALQFYKLAHARFGPDSIIIYGRSLGSGIAAQLASIRNCKALILETAYYDFPSIAKTWLPVYPLSRMVHFKIPTWQYLQKVNAPITIFHGSSDGIISYRNCKKLKQVLKPADQFITIDGGSHNDLYKFPLTSQKLDSILNR